MNSKVRAEQIAMRLGVTAPLPQVVRRAVRALDDPRLSSLELTKLLGADQGVSTMLIAIANSTRCDGGAHYKGLRDVIAGLGHKNTQAILCAVAAYPDLCRPVTLYGMGPDELWSHSVACAITSRFIAQQYDLWDPDEAYIAGLLHDIGLPAMERFAKTRDRLVHLIRTSDYPSHMAEQMVLGFDHAHLGSLICRNWGLSQDLVAAVSTHHEPLECERPTTMSAIVHLADNISLRPEAGSGSHACPVVADTSVMDWLDFEPGEISRIDPRIRSHLLDPVPAKDQCTAN